MPQIVCTACLCYLTDYNKGDFHMCAECAWSGKNDDPDSDSDDKDFTFFCSDCDRRMHNWHDKMYGQCSSCRKEERRKNIEEERRKNAENSPVDTLA